VFPLNVRDTHSSSPKNVFEEGSVVARGPKRNGRRGVIRCIYYIVMRIVNEIFEP
jgi:hypothetical protein